MTPSPFRRIVVAVLASTAAFALGCGNNLSPLTPSTTSSSPFVQTDLVIGTGATANSGNRVTVAYTGWLYDPSKPDSKGAAFDSSNGYTLQFTASNVIQGWVRGVAGMKVGGQRRLIIPPDLGYGAQMVGSIPPNSTLVFEVTLLNVL